MVGKTTNQTKLSRVGPREDSHGFRDVLLYKTQKSRVSPVSHSTIDTYLVWRNETPTNKQSDFGMTLYTGTAVQ